MRDIKNKLCSSNKVDVDNSIVCITIWSPLDDNLEHTKLRMVCCNVWRGEVIQNCLVSIKYCLIWSLQIDQYMIEHIGMKRLAL